MVYPKANMTAHSRFLIGFFGAAAALVVGVGTVEGQTHKPPKPPASLRLYIFDCGIIHTTNGDAYSLKKEEMASTEMSIPCILVAHPKGTLMWDNGDIPDRVFPAGRRPRRARSRHAGQAAAAAARGCRLYAGGHHLSVDVALSRRSRRQRQRVRQRHLAGAKGGTRSACSRTSRFRDRRSENYNELKNSKTVLIDKDEYDVFGDGTVVIKSTPGHTPGHNVLFLKLKKTGPVVLSGDLYHYPEERTLNRLPVADFNKEQTAASRAELEIFLKKTGAQLWIEHDIIGNAKLKKAPAFYE